MSRTFRLLALLILFAAGMLTGAALLFVVMVNLGVNPALSQGSVVLPTAAPTATPPPEAQFNEVEAFDAIMINLYERANRSVVHITSHTQQMDMFYGVVPSEGTGSGFVYDTAGYIVTNNHVVTGADQIDVVMATGESLPATVVGVDTYYDLAVLKIDTPANTLVPLELGDSSLLRVGQTVIAIGNPFGLDRTMTRGLVSALGRRVETDQGSVIGQAIQTDAAINPGNSGGPLLDLRGRVVGINTAIRSDSGGSVGIGFAVPSSVVKRVVPVLIKDGHYPHPSLGATFAELGTEVSPPSQGPAHGLLITELEAGGPAAQAGLRKADVQVQRRRYVLVGGDIIVAVGGKQVGTRNDLLLALEESFHPGDSVPVTVIRDGKDITIPLTLGSG